MCGLAAIQRLVVPVKLGRTISGQSILRATKAFDEVLEKFYPELLVVDVDGIEPAASPAP
jgi:hypothetical protein